MLQAEGTPNPHPNCCFCFTTFLCRPRLCSHSHREFSCTMPCHTQQAQLTEDVHHLQLLHSLCFFHAELWALGKSLSIDDDFKIKLLKRQFSTYVLIWKYTLTVKSQIKLWSDLLRVEDEKGEEKKILFPQYISIQLLFPLDILLYTSNFYRMNISLLSFKKANEYKIIFSKSVGPLSPVYIQYYADL